MGNPTGQIINMCMQGRSMGHHSAHRWPNISACMRKSYSESNRNPFMVVIDKAEWTYERADDAAGLVHEVQRRASPSERT